MASPRKQVSSLRDVTNEVTKEKLNWLENQRKILKSHYAKILEKYEKPENKASLKFLKEVHETLKNCPDGDNPAESTTKDLSVFLNWIDTESEDGLIYFGSKQLVSDWIAKLVEAIQNQIEKCEYSCLYAGAMTKYMESSQDEAPVKEAGAPEEAKKTDEVSDKNETIAEFERRVFSAPAPDDFKKEAFEELLQKKLFDLENKEEESQLLLLQDRTKTMCKHFAEWNPISEQDLKQCIDSLVKEDLLGKEKNVTMKELKANSDALQEVVSLLNKRLKNYSSWKWPEPVVVQFKRNIAGRYRAYMDEDILTALLLHYIGAKWSIHFKSIFTGVYNSNIWKRGTGTVGDLYYQQNSIEGFRREFHEMSFLTVLPDSMDDLAGATPIYDDEMQEIMPRACAMLAEALSPVDSDAASMMRKKLGAPKRAPPPKPRRPKNQNPSFIKQQLLHMISNEIFLNKILRPENPLTIVQTDMEWFGPSLIHETVLSVFKYFGVTEEWLDFFKRFLEAPMRINSPTAPIKVRKRGSPISHQLTNMFGESLLFLMDLYVNRESELSIYRIHDDFWFWSHRKENVIKAWNAMQNFTKLAGLKLNEEKSASVVCGNDEKVIIPGPAPLPQKNVQWGFVTLYSDGVFRINDKLLALHVKEMQEYLGKADNIMTWIHGHNRYIRFFIRNFGEPARTFGKQHVAQIMEKLKDILKQVHHKTGGDAVEELQMRFGNYLKGKDVMDSWIYWPVKSGGLALYNPFLELVPLHEAYRQEEENDEKMGNAKGHFGAQLQADKTNWKYLLERSKERRKKRAQHVEYSEAELEEETISDEEVYNENEDFRMRGQISDSKRDKRVDFQTRCLRYRETRCNNWRHGYSNLLENVRAVGVMEHADWQEGLYLDQLERKLGHGEREFVDGNLVPLSLISAMQNERVHKSS